MFDDIGIRDATGQTRWVNTGSVCVTRSNPRTPYVQRLECVLGQPINETSLPDAVFTVVRSSDSAVFASTATTGLYTEDANITISLTNATSVLTGDTIALHLASGSITDWMSRVYSTVGPIVTTIVDGAEPGLLSASGSPGSDVLMVRFSEAVVQNASAHLSDWQLSGFATSVSIVSAPTLAAPDTVALQLNRTLDLDDLESSTVKLLAASVYSDAAGNRNLDNQTVSVSNGDLTPPTITDIETQDLNHNGKLDHVLLSFSEPVIGGTTASGWSIGGLIVTSVDIPNPSSILLGVREGASFNSGLVPRVRAAADSVFDLSGNALVSAT